MRTARLWAVTGAVGLAIGCTVAATLPAAASPGPARSKLQGSLTPAIERSHPADRTEALTDDDDDEAHGHRDQRCDPHAAKRSQCA